MVSKYCEYCGRTIIPKSKNAVKQYYCSKECRDASRRGLYNEKKRDARSIKRIPIKQKKSGCLDYCMKEANRLGISYGQYMVRREAGLYK